MKHLLKIVFLFIAAGILFTACKTMSVTKRHYNKGYYVSHSAKKSKVNVTSEAEKQTSASVEPLAAKVTKLPEAVTKDKELLASNVENSSVIKTRDQKVAENKIKYAGIYNNLSVKEVVKNPFKLTKIVAASDSKDDALSLIWIIIVVILILYLLGLLLDFGGPFIHVLAVIALILLILWLLKVI